MTAGMENDYADECIDGQIEAAEGLLPDSGFTPDDPDTCALPSIAHSLPALAAKGRMGGCQAMSRTYRDRPAGLSRRTPGARDSSPICGRTGRFHATVSRWPHTRIRSRTGGIFRSGIGTA